jgi:hypothetical protein
VWTQFREAISDLCSEQRANAMTTGANRILDIHNATWKGLNHSGNRPDEEFKKDIAFVKAQASAWSEATADTLASVGNTTDLRLRWLAILRDWNTLDQYIRLQRLERGLPWFDRQIDSMLQGYLTIDQHPLRSFFAMHEGPSWSPDMPRDVYTNNMYGAQAVVESQHLGSSQEAFDKMRTRNPERFPTTRVNGYPQEVEKSTKRMSDLRYYVEEIQKNGWPTASD